jgi:hypothetical protein
VFEGNKWQKRAFNISEYFRKEVEIMKMFLFCYPQYLDDTVSSEFKQAGYNSYMKLHSATGKDEPYDAKQGIHHVAGEIRALFMYMPAEMIPHALDIVRRIKEKLPNENMRAFTWMLEECC